MIKFNSSSPTHSEFSNYHRSPFTLDGKDWKTVEHYYQAYKFLPHDPEWAEQVRKASGPGTAKKMAWSEEHPIRVDWDEIKDAVMIRALRAKFAADPELQRLLLSTDGQQLVEHTPWGDFYWGDGGDGTGKNRLGEMLMELREQGLASRDDAI